MEQLNKPPVVGVVRNPQTCNPIPAFINGQRNPCKSVEDIFPGILARCDYEEQYRASRQRDRDRLADAASAEYNEDGELI